MNRKERKEPKRNRPQGTFRSRNVLARVMNNQQGGAKCRIIFIASKKELVSIPTAS